MSSTFCVYRGAEVCARLFCPELLDRYGHCPDGHYSGSLWSDDAVEIEVDVSGTPYSHKGSSTEPDDCGVDDVCAEFEGKPFPLTTAEQERADEEFAEAEEAAAWGRYEDAMEAKAEAAREREMER